ncbi:MAG: guanylate kinase [Clostridia bacterium]|nr:guanylate kinase [Clostridia bacterium]
MKGILFVLSGPSGTGKGTVCERLLEKEPLHLSVSATTRDIREGETDGVTYHYVSVPEFEGMIKNGEMLEYASYNGNYYGTPKKSVADLLDTGHDVLLEIEPQGALQVKSIIPEAVLVFLVPPSMQELKNRLITRGRENSDEIKERLAASQWELRQADKYNKQIVNDDLDRCVNEVRAYIAEKRGERNMIEALINEKV